MAVLICGSVAYDNIMVFEGRFKEHILPDQIHILNVSFLVPEIRQEFGGCAACNEKELVPLKPRVNPRVRVVPLLLAGILGALIVRGRAGYRVKSIIPVPVLRWGTWALVALFGLSAVANIASSSNWERFLNAPIALLLALLCFVVARGAVPARQA